MEKNDEGKNVLILDYMKLVVEKPIIGQGAFCKV